MHYSAHRPASIVIASQLTLLIAGCASGGSAHGQELAPLFTDTERQAIQTYWNAPGRYVVEPSPEIKERVNITVPGSQWYARYVRQAGAVRKGVAKPTPWDGWIAAKLAFDKAAAAGKAIADPGPTPPDLKAAIGDPPPLYEMVHPQRYTVTFAPEDAPKTFVYTDNIAFADRKTYFTSYRQTVGVVQGGKKVGKYEGDEKKALDALFASVARSPAEQHVLLGVSALEGGFESVNTYDNGYVSIGLIQFIFARDGNGSLSSVLQQMKTDDPTAFQADFHRFGVDVGPDRIVDVVDLATGTEKHGADAVQAIINDKRLTAVFERAGGHDPFRRAQLVIAQKGYWPGDDPVMVTRLVLKEQKGGAAAPTVLGTFVSGSETDTPPEVAAALAAAPTKQQTDPGYRCWVDTETLTAKVSDIIRSEAGLATLMDRKVNTGNIRGLSGVVADIMQANRLQKIEDVIPYERTIDEKMKYRAEFLNEKALTQPPAPPRDGVASTASR